MLCPRQIVLLLPAFAAGIGLTVTDTDAEAEGPLHPFAVTETIAVPENPAAHVTVAEVPVPLMVFPEPVTFQL